MEKIALICCILLTLHIIWMLSKDSIIGTIMKYVTKHHSLTRKLVQQGNELTTAFQEQEKKIRLLEEKLNKFIKEEQCHTK